MYCSILHAGLPCKLPLQRKCTSAKKRGRGRGRGRQGKRKRCSDSESSSESDSDSSEEEWQPWKEETRKRSRAKGTGTIMGYVFVCFKLSRIVFLTISYTEDSSTGFSVKTANTHCCQHRDCKLFYYCIIIVMNYTCIFTRHT